MSLKAVIIDSHALSRDLLGTVLRSGSYEIVASRSRKSRKSRTRIITFK